MDKKDAHLTIRISPEELKEIKLFATNSGMQQSEFVLSAIRAAMGKTDGIEESFLALSVRLAAIETRLDKQQVA